MQTNKILLYVGVILVFVAFIAGYFIKKPTYKVPEGKVLISQKMLDSLTYIANLPPDTIVKNLVVYDTLWIVKTHNPQPQPDLEDSTLNVYCDSLVIKDTVNVSVRFKTTGLIRGGIEWRFKPIYHFKETIINKPVPYLITEYTSVPAYKTGFYLSGVASGNNNMFIFGLDFDFVTKNDYIYGLEYRKFGNENIYGVKLGINLNKFFKRNKDEP